MPESGNKSKFAVMMIYYLRSTNRYALHPPKNSNIGIFFFLLRFFFFVDWEKFPTRT